MDTAKKPVKNLQQQRTKLPRWSWTLRFPTNGHVPRYNKRGQPRERGDVTKKGAPKLPFDHQGPVGERQPPPVIDECTRTTKPGTGELMRIPASKQCDVCKDKCTHKGCARNQSPLHADSLEGGVMRLSVTAACQSRFRHACNHAHAACEEQPTTSLSVTARWGGLEGYYVANRVSQRSSHRRRCDQV